MYSQNGNEKQLMKLLLIKIGKAWHVLKRDGLWRGGRRVLMAGMALFGRVGHGDILFITGGVGDSARYRTSHVAEMLQIQGFKTSVTVQDNPFLLTYASKFSIFVFHRVLYTSGVAKLIRRIKKNKKEIIFEADDLVYDPVFFQHMDYFNQMNALEYKLYEHGVGGEILSDPYVKACTASTSFLANKLCEKGKQVFVVPNRVSQADVKRAEKILRDVKKNASVVRVVYLSGTPSHNKDFAAITDALLVLLEKYPQMRLVVVGPLDIDSQLQKFAERIERIPFMPRAKYFSAVARMDVNLAPLEIGDPFCEAKSELKWIEAGLVGVPTVAAATGTFSGAITDGVDGFVSATTEEWIEKIGKLIVSENLRKQIGEAARSTVIAYYTTICSNDTEYYDYLRKKIV